MYFNCSLTTWLVIKNGLDWQYNTCNYLRLNLVFFGTTKEIIQPPFNGNACSVYISTTYLCWAPVMCDQNCAWCPVVCNFALQNFIVCYSPWSRDIVLKQQWKWEEAKVTNKYNYSIFVYDFFEIKFCKCLNQLFSTQ